MVPAFKVHIRTHLQRLAGETGFPPSNCRANNEYSLHWKSQKFLGDQKSTSNLFFLVSLEQFTMGKPSTIKEGMQMFYSVCEKERRETYHVPSVKRLAGLNSEHLVKREKTMPQSLFFPSLCTLVMPTHAV